MALARGTVLLPNNRARTAVHAAFVRALGGGALLPRMVVIGDDDLAEAAGAGLDQLAGTVVPPPATPPLRRQMLLAEAIARDYRAAGAPLAPAVALALGRALGGALDQLHFERLTPADLAAALPDNLAAHWQTALVHLISLADRWPVMLAATGTIDLADRRNRLLDQLAAAWAAAPPPPDAGRWVVAAGVNVTAPAVAALLRAVADLPHGLVLLHGLDAAMADDEWDALGPTARPVPGEAEPPRLEAHPQYHLKLLLDRMGVARAEVQPWPATSPLDGPAARSMLAGAMFTPAAFTARWAGLRAELGGKARGLAQAVFPTNAAEAQGIALMLRHCLDTPGQTAALVTPDRDLAGRVAQLMARWGVAVDDSAGQPLAQTPPGVLLTLMARYAAAPDPVGLVAMLSHPLVRGGAADPAARLAWLDRVRALDLLLREPGIDAAPAGVAARLARLAADAGARDCAAAAALIPWWAEVAAALDGALGTWASGDAAAPAELLAGAVMLGNWLTGCDGDDGAHPPATPALWRGPAGRMLAATLDELAAALPDGPARLVPADMAALLDGVLAAAAVRPGFGQHPRLFIWGLLEARMQRADVMILAGLNQDGWPGPVAADPWLAPGVRRQLGMPGPGRAQGLAAHDFAAALGAARVVVTRADQQGDEPANPSPLWLRLDALAGPMAVAAIDGVPLTVLAAELDLPAAPPPVAQRPALTIAAGHRRPRLSVSAVDLLAHDPYGYCARAILRLAQLPLLGGLSDARWTGQQVHAVLCDWVAGGGAPAALDPLVDAMAAHPALSGLERAIWVPQMRVALHRAARQIAADRAEGRVPVGWEASGQTDVAGVTITGRADRIDRLADGTLGIVDYKTGNPPAAVATARGQASQLGLLGLIAGAGGFAENRTPGPIAAAPASHLAYWHLAAAPGADPAAMVKPPYASRGEALPDAAAVMERCRTLVSDLAGEYLFGDAAFAPGAKVADGGPSDYAQLMRRDEWFGGRGADQP